MELEDAIPSPSPHLIQKEGYEGPDLLKFYTQKSGSNYPQNSLEV
jgi:hypothetical protein